MKKLQLTRETLLRLTDEEQFHVQGGMLASNPVSNNTRCPSETPQCKQTSKGCDIPI